MYLLNRITIMDLDLQITWKHPVHQRPITSVSNYNRITLMVNIFEYLKFWDKKWEFVIFIWAMNWCVAEFNFEHEPSRSEVITHTAILSGNKNLNSVRMNKTLPSLPLSSQSTAGDEGPVADISCMNIFSHFQGLLTTVQLPATRWSAQTWISC